MPLKSIIIRLADIEGTVYRWRIQYVPRAVNCVLGQNPRVISGWEFTDHEEYKRFSEGNWRDLVAHFKAIAENYGLTLLSDLS